MFIKPYGHSIYRICCLPESLFRIPDNRYVRALLLMILLKDLNLEYHHQDLVILRNELRRYLDKQDQHWKLMLSIQLHYL